ncbi:MAG: LLM class F420-dependent oxidoreductase, partial [Pseudomonadota bacterium]|nr:LLM class F420-dependent oxidoreductase [Pseudomonadota bacterium]
DRIAFYGCTVAYRPVLEIHGWGELQDELISLNRQRRRNEMSRLISDEVLETLAIVGDPRSVVEQMLRRFGSLIDRTGFSVPNISDDELGSVLEQLRS